MPTHDDDAPLSAPAKAEVRLTDSTLALDPATFDPQAFINGMRPTRRSVKIHARADLLGVMDRLAGQIDGADEDEDVDDLIADYYQARDTFVANIAFWTVEKRSSEWLKAHREACARDLGITLKDGAAVKEQDGLRLLFEQIAAQVVEINGEPAEVSAEQIRAMYDANEGEVNKLAEAIRHANEVIAGSAAKDLVTRDFSQRSSTGRSGQAS